MFTIGCMLYSTFAAKYSTHQTVCTFSRLDSVKSSVTAVLDINAYIFESRYLRLFCGNVGHTMRLIFHIWCQISRFVLCQLWTLQNLAELQFLLLMLKYCFQSLSACFAHTSTIRCALYSTFATVTLPISLFEICQLWSLPKPAKMQFCIFRNKYSDQRDYISIAGM